jgi:hypothetical protein
VIEYDNNTLLSFKHIVNSLSQIQNKEHLRTYGSKYKEFFARLPLNKYGELGREEKLSLL